MKDHRTTTAETRSSRSAHVAVDANETHDLGFGSVVASESRQRLLNRDGSFNVFRTGLGFWASRSPYHVLINASWKQFLLFVTGVYLLTNVAFALAYMLCGPGALVGPSSSVFGDSFLRAFFFSVETLSTVGYGIVSPIGIAANLVVMVECLVGILFLALSTGLIFARFSRPTAKIIYSNRAVVGPYRDITALMFRTTNARNSQIVELHANVLLARFENDDGRFIRRFYRLKLERDMVVLFPLSWTIVHPIDEESPLYGLTGNDLKNANCEILIVLTGMDEIFSQTVHSRSSYTADEIVWNAKFSDIYVRSSDTGLLTVDIRRLHKIEPA